MELTRQQPELAEPAAKAIPEPEITDEMIGLFWRKYTVTEVTCSKKAFREAHAYMMSWGRKA